MRFSPAAIALAVAAGFVIVADAVIVVVPAVLADPQPTVMPSPSAPASELPTEIAFADPTADPSLPDWSGYEPVEWPSPGVPIPTPTAKPTPAPTPRDTVWNARTYVKNRIGARQYDCINAVWTAESGWNPRASNPSSGAYGIPQAVPGSKMAAFGANWRYSPLIQVKWGIWYVTNRYGSACAAYAFWQAHGWY